jgi:membrane fusion protein, multidrug efflux system
MKKAYILLIFPLLIACGNKESKESVEKSYTEIKTDVAFEKAYSNSTEYSGTFFANKEANLGTSMPGKIEKYYYKPGTYVKSGTLLVELSSEVLTQALIEFDAIKKDFDRVSRLKDKGSISEIEFDHIKANWTLLR